MSIASMFPDGIGVGNLFDYIQGDSAIKKLNFVFLLIGNGFIQILIFEIFYYS